MSFDAVLPTRRVRDRIRGKPVRERQLRQHEKLRVALQDVPPQRAKGLGPVLRAVVELTNRDGESAHEASLTLTHPDADGRGVLPGSRVPSGQLLPVTMAGRPT